MGKGWLQWVRSWRTTLGGRQVQQKCWLMKDLNGRAFFFFYHDHPHSTPWSTRSRVAAFSQTTAPMHSETFIRNHPPNTPRSTVGPTCFLRKEGHSIGVSGSWAAWPVSPGNCLELIVASTPSQQHEPSIRTSTNATQETPEHTHLHYT